MRLRISILVFLILTFLIFNKLYYFNLHFRPLALFFKKLYPELNLPMKLVKELKISSIASVTQFFSTLHVDYLSAINLYLHLR